MQSSLEQKQKPKDSCCQEKTSLNNQQMNHLINVIKQRYISPYKIIYMINQQEADYFKMRNQGKGCCASAIITIPKDQMTKTELFLFQAITQSFKPQNLSKTLETLSDKLDNIVKSGEKQNLKVDDQVEKFLLEKTLSEGFNSYLYKTVAQRLKKQSEFISNSAMLWATPQTWYAKYPKIPLNFLSSQSLSNLNNPNRGYAIEPDFLKQYKQGLSKQLRLLQQDGKFQQQLWLQQQLNIRNDTKVLDCLENYCFDGTEQSYRQGQITYPNLKKSLITLRSIPFQLNAKLNVYSTISENNQVSYFKKSLICKLKDQPKVYRFSTFCPISQEKLNCRIKSKKSQQLIQQTHIRSGQLLIIDNQLSFVELEANLDYAFLFRSWISTLAKKN